MSDPMKRKPVSAIWMSLIASLLSTQIAMAQQSDTAGSNLLRLFIGTGAEAIYSATFDPQTGSLSQPEVAAETKRPSFIWTTPATESLYSVSELRQGKQTSDASIVAWAVDEATGKLTLRNRQGALGDGPCFVTVGDDQRYAAIANYGSGSVTVYPLEADGSLEAASGHVQHTGSSADPDRQREPHAHSICFDPSGKRLAAADLGTDKIYLYDLQADGSLEPSLPAAIELDPATGPRHFVFSPDQRYLLALGEISGTITSYRYDPPSIKKIAVVSTMADDAPADAARASAEILFHPNGKFVYCSNRGPNEIVGFAYDAERGTLRRLFAISGGGEHPRNFRLSPDGRFLLVANQQSDNVVVFAVDGESGQLRPTGEEMKVPSPMCLKFWTPSTR